VTIMLGTPLVDADGIVGIVTGFAADIQGNGIEEILVGQTTRPYEERCVPLALLTLIAKEGDGAIHLDPGTRDFWTLPDESPASAREPTADRRGTSVGGAVAVAAAPTGVQGQRSAFGPSEAPIIALGTGVFDRTGQRVGHVRQMAVDSSSGRVLRLILSRGPAFSDLPGSWIDKVSARGVILIFSSFEMALRDHSG